MKSSLVSLLSLALGALMTSCYSPYPPIDHTAPAPAPGPVPSDTTTATVGDRAQQQLDAARERLKEEERQQARENLGLDNLDNNPVSPVVPTTYRYATKVDGKDGFVHNPYTQNQVDVRGIPSGTLVRDPHDSNPAHKFRVP